MLISFTFENFRSFADRATLSMVAHGAHKGMASVLIDPLGPLPDASHLLPVGAIYGANAAGKSNVLRAYDYFRNAVMQSQTRWEPDGGTYSSPHALKADRPSTFEVECLVEGTRYRYGFEAYPTHFASEWLYSYPKRRERLLFRRTTSPMASEVEVEFGPNLVGNERDNRSIARRTRPNSLFLSAAAQDNQFDASAVQKWVGGKTEALKHDWDIDDYAFTNRIYAQHPEHRDKLFDMLKAADPDLNEVRVRERDITPDIGDLDEFDLKPSTKEFVVQNRKYNAEFVFGTKEAEISLPLGEQSDGLKRMYGFASVISFVLSLGEVVFIDEIEASLHPHVSSQIIALFQNPTTNPKGAQLIFTTHDTSLLSSDTLRRDQIWFVEKKSGASSLYSLLEFKPRKDESIENSYLRGRYGAIPAVGMARRFVGQS